jgi:hypothetical protein
MDEEKIQPKKSHKIYCPSCTKSVNREAVVCPNCGVQLKELNVSEKVRESNYEKQGQYRVTTGYIDKINMPPGCVYCGNPDASNAYLAKIEKSNLKGTRSTSYMVSFPLCNDCNNAHLLIEKQSTFGCQLSLIVGFVTLIIATAIIITTTSISYIYGLIVGFSSALITFIVVKVLKMRKTKRDVRTRANGVRNSVKIVELNTGGVFRSASIVWEFGNRDYALKFSNLNGGGAGLMNKPLKNIKV